MSPKFGNMENLSIFFSFNFDYDKSLFQGNYTHNPGN